jgi:hypothetical protein
MRRTKYTRRTVLLHHAKSRRVKLRPSIQYTDQVDEANSHAQMMCEIIEPQPAAYSDYYT